MKSKNVILVVEDKQNERLAIARLLAQEDYEVKMAGDPEEAIAFLDEPIDLVVSDLRMGENSGVDLLRMWKPPAGHAVRHRDGAWRRDVGGRGHEARRR